MHLCSDQPSAVSRQPDIGVSSQSPAFIAKSRTLDPLGHPHPSPLPCAGEGQGEGISNQHPFLVKIGETQLAIYCFAVHVILNVVKNLSALQCDFFEMFRYAQHDNVSTG